MLRIRGIKIEVTKKSSLLLKKMIAQKLKISESEILEYSLYKESLDARDKKNILFVYEVRVKVSNEEKILKRLKTKDIFKDMEEKYNFKKKRTLPNRPIIVGSGPAGLFAALILAENNENPIIIERGEKIENRTKTVKNFWENNELNENSNVQFGEGGAGTFSDGKLNTLIKNQHSRMQKVFETFVECGAPKEILYSYKPHIGTDILRTVIINLREKIKSLGGEFYYNSCMTDLLLENNQVKGIQINHKETLLSNHVILAIGHSARDTFRLLLKRNVNIKSKPFAIGLRVMHPQKTIDEALLGKIFSSLLGPASYKLTHTCASKRGVYSFCMCPGGFIVNASSNKNQLVVNGMSYSRRDSGYANSAIVVTVNEKDYGLSPLSGLEFQEKLEKNAYNIGEGKIPIETLKDFKMNSLTQQKEFPCFKGKTKYCHLKEILPDFISKSILESFEHFGKTIPHFDDDNTILAAIETRTSSPVRILRNDDYESNRKGLYPCGEGAGYAGGITSSAIDGIKVAEALLVKEVDNS